MAKEIAVYVNNRGNTQSMNHNGRIVVFKKYMNEWSVVREKQINFDKNKGLKALRWEMDQAIDFLEDCKIFVASAVTGIPYFTLEKADCSVWEYDGNPAEFLNYILEQEEAAHSKKKPLPENVVPIPLQIGKGCYRISIKDIQESNSSVTSKQALLPFLRKSKFYSLEVICNHVPLWLEGELFTLNYKHTMFKVNENEIRLLIEPKACSECI